MRPHKAHLLRKKRGQSVSDGMSRASLGVFAVNLPGSLAAEPPLSPAKPFSKTIGVKRPVGVALATAGHGVQGRGEIKDTKDFNDINDAHCQ